MPYPLPILDAWQTTFFWSVLSNRVSSVGYPSDSTLTPEAARKAAEQGLSQRLATEINAVLENTLLQQAVGSDWQIAWGPAIYVAEPKSNTAHPSCFYASNAMMVMHSPSQKRYIVAIAGTNPASVFDWLSEDISLSPGYDWASTLASWKSGHHDIPQKGHKNTATVDNCTFTGVSALLNNMQSNDQSLVTFLQGVDTSGHTLTLTGHSLGGALSPMLALALVDPTHALQSNWRADQVQVYATAGATPGNAALAAHYLQVFPPRKAPDALPWQVWNSTVWNQFDVVPRAWAHSTLDAMPTLYAAARYQEQQEYPDLAALNFWITTARIKANGFAAIYGPLTHLNTPTVNGMLNPDATPENGFAWCVNGDLLLTPAQMVTDQQATPIEWLKQVNYQHVAAYGILMKIPADIISAVATKPEPQS